MEKQSVSNLRQLCLDLLHEDSGLLFANGLDDAIVGIGERDGVEVVVYDSEKIIRILRSRDKMSREEACEFYEMNIVGAWMGEGTPLFIRLVKRR